MKEVSMRSPDHYLFFAETVEGDYLSIGSLEAHHATAVLRLRKGDAFSATDGKGQLFSARVEQTEKHSLRAAINDRRTANRVGYDIKLFIGLPERDAFESILESVTPLGVRTIIPVTCRFCQKAWWNDKWEKLSSRFAAKMVVAMKQSLYPYIPQLHHPVSFAEMYAMQSGNVLVADIEGATIGTVLNSLQQKQVSVVIGPPGGFSPEETAALRSIESKPVRISHARLRTELAAIVACAQITGYWAE